MTVQPGAVLNTVAFGNRPEGVEVPTIQSRAPTSSDWNYPIGKRWVNKVSGSEYVLASVVGSAGVNTATWTLLGSGGTLNTLTTSDTNVVTPSSGNINLVQGSNILTTGSGANATIALVSSPSVSGSLTAGTTITATLGAITATNGNVVLGTAGNKIVIATGANASVGTSGAMSGTPGAVTVATTASSATAKIFYSRATTGGTPGQVSITAQDGTGFTLTSTGNETSTFNWWIINA